MTINPGDVVVDITTQAEADERIPALLKIPAAKRIVRVRPGEGIDLSCLKSKGIEIDALRGIYREYCESGIDYPAEEQIHDGGPKLAAVMVEGTDKPIHPDWVRSLRDQAIGAGVPFTFLSWGDWGPVPNGGNETGAGVFLADGLFVDPYDLHDDSGIDVNTLQWMYKVGRKHSGRVLDGEIWEGVTG